MNIPETVLRHIIKLDIPSTTWQVFLSIIHKIGCTEGRININDIAYKMGIHANSVSRSIKILKDRNIIRKGNLNNYAVLNTNINEWVLQTDRRVREKPVPPTPIEVKIHPLFDTKGFRKFYEVYPRKIGFKKAMEAWAKLNPSPELAKLIISQVICFKASEEWKKVRFIPSPVTFLEGERWKDQLTFQKDWRDI